MLDFPTAPLPKNGANRRTLSSTAPLDSRNSSLNNVWSDDYFQNDENENYFNNIIATPLAATVTERPFPRSIPLCEDEDQAYPRHRTDQRSLTTLIPFRRTRTNSISPTRSPIREDTQSYTDEKDITFTGDTETPERRPGGLSSWFTGSSAPVSVGVVVDEFEATTVLPPPSTSSSRTASPERAKLRKRPTMASASTNSFGAPTPQPEKVASTSRFAFFGAKTPTQKTMSIPAELSDDFLSMNIRDTLFPGGMTDTDVFSPSAFKNLLANAEGILSKLQTAYQVRTLALHDLRSEKESRDDELEEAETRSRHLKMQLQEMALQVSSHDAEMAALKLELQHEREARRKEKEEREESVKLIRAHGSSPSSPSYQTSRTSEDLGVEQSRRLRSRLSETSFSSDVESTSGGESVFSRSMSPTGTYASTSTSNECTPEITQAAFHTVQKVQLPSPVSLMNKQETRTPVKVKTGMFGKILGGGRAEVQEVTSCSNCQGGEAAVAWDTVGLLKMENRGLKERVGELEDSVEDALDLVRGLSLRP